MFPKTLSKLLLKTVTKHVSTRRSRKETLPKHSSSFTSSYLVVVLVTKSNATSMKELAKMACVSQTHRLLKKRAYTPNPCKACPYQTEHQLGMSQTPPCCSHRSIFELGRVHIGYIRA